MTFFVDNNLSTALAAGMKEFAAKTRRPFAFRVPPSGTKFTSLALD